MIAVRHAVRNVEQVVDLCTGRSDACSLDATRDHFHEWPKGPFELCRIHIAERLAHFVGGNKLVVGMSPC